jgi:hypothetical protein
MFRNPFLIFDLDKQHPWFHEGGLSTDWRNAWPCIPKLKGRTNIYLFFLSG